jgi:TonB family protein
MSRHLLSSIFLALLWFAAAPATAADGPWTYTASYRISVDPTGRAHYLEASPRTPPAVIASTSAAIEGWTFEPAKRDGAAVAAEVWLHVRYSVRRGDNGYQFDIADAGIGPGVPVTSLPEFPPTAVRAGCVGTMMLKVAIDADGNPTSVTEIGELQWRQVARAVLKSVKSWHFAPQKVGGAGIAESVTVPVEFDLTPGGAEAEGLAVHAPGVPQPSQSAISERPVVKLLSAPR